MDVFQLEILYVKEKNFWKSETFFTKGHQKFIKWIVIYDSNQSLNTTTWLESDFMSLSSLFMVENQFLIKASAQCVL